MIFTALASSSHGNAYLLDDGQTHVLIECGIPFRRLQKELDFEMGDIRGCLLSHEHGDHSKCYGDILKCGIPIYTSGGTADALGCDLMCEARAGESFSIGSFEVLPFQTFHDAADPFGYLIRSLVDGDKLMFATDTVSLGYRFPGINQMAIECNYAEDILARATKMPEKVRHRITNSHMDIDRLCAYLRTADLSRCRRIYLLHLSDGCSNEWQFLERVRSVCCGVEVVACPR